MAANRRIYAVTQLLQAAAEGQAGHSIQYLVRASSPAQAIRHLVRKSFSAEVASQDAIVTAMQLGTTVQDAKQDAGE
jgi:2-methylcitrate dehydratase PrpD